MRILFQNQCLVWAALYFTLMAVVPISCMQSMPGEHAGYNIKRPQKVALGKVLNEISGLNFYADSSMLLAIADSKRNIFAINLRTQKLRDFAVKFWEKGDYEDLVKVGSTVYVLISDGTIVAVPPYVKDNSRSTAYSFPSPGPNDFESMYFDPAANGLVIICKSCADERGKGHRTAYRFDLSSRKFDSTAFFEISSDAVKTLIKNDDAAFKPSAAAIHPIEKRLYILSSASHLLVITDLRGKVEEVINLNPDTHPQAEGIAFSPNGTMFISNEAKYGKATLQIFPYKKGRLIGKKTN